MRTGQARKRDANEDGIVKALEAAGAQVLRIGAKDAPDLLVRVGAFVNVSDVPPGRRWGKYVLMEVKSVTGRNRVEPGQRAFQVRWPETITVRTAEEALQAIGAIT